MSQQKEKPDQPVSLAIPEWLRVYRSRLDDLDAEIVALLCQRHDIIREVGQAKAEADMAAVLPDRVTEVIENAARLAAETGGDAALIRRIYTDIVQTSCALEEDIIASQASAD